MKVSDEVVRGYKQNGLTVFTLRLGEVYNDKHKKWKKTVDALPKWQQTTVTTPIQILPKHNALGLLTGQVSGVFVLDIDALDHWTDWLLPTVRTASGGLHFYFLFTDSVKEIKGTAKCFGGHWEIDSRTTGIFVYAPPTSLVTENVKWQYTWVRSVFEFPLVELPQYIVQWLVERPGNAKGISARGRAVAQVADSGVTRALHVTLQSPEVGTRTSGRHHQWAAIVPLIGNSKWDDYNSWLAIGINVKSLTNPDEENFKIWKTASQKSGSYDEGCCEKRWAGLPTNDVSSAENVCESYRKSL